MRIKAVHVAGVAAALIGGAAKDALADTTVTTATTAPLQTSTAGNVTVNSGGSIAVTANQAAITVNSNTATVLNGGALTSKDADDSIGILLGNGVTGASITSSGSITLNETYAIVDTDSDGDLDGPWAQGSGRFGILLNAGSAFGGNITSSGAITINGNDSAAISLNARVNGAVGVSSAIVTTGDRTTGIAILGGAGAGVSGDVSLSGTVTTRGEGSQAVVIDAPIDGALRINGSYVSTGFHSTTAPADTSKLELPPTANNDELLSGATIAVHSNVAGGVTLQGIGVEDDVDDDGDGITEAAGDTNDNTTVSVSAIGSAPAVLIQADPAQTMTLGVDTKGFGLDVRGSVTALGVYSGIAAHAITILGSGAANSTVINGGIALDRTVTVNAVEADAFGLTIGNGASTPQILQRGTFSTTSVADTLVTVTGFSLDAGANVPVFSNTGSITTQVLGETGSAVGIVDHSNSLATITNTGSLVSRVIATDSDPTDNIPPPPVTGKATAIDVSSSTINVTYNQSPDVPFTDDDTVDNDAASRPTIQTIGAIKFGSGADTLNLSAGTITGDVSFGAGADVMNVTNGTTYTGHITDSDGNLTLNVTAGTLALQGGTTNITTANFGATSQLGVTLAVDPTATTDIVASGSVTFAAGARILPVVPVGLPTSGVFTFLTANGGLIGGANVTGVVSGTGVPYVYNLNINQVGNSLAANFDLKTATQLGLNSNQTIAFTPIINALRQDNTASNAFASLTTRSQFESAYGQLMPSYSTASTELATTAIQQQQSATTNRLASTRLNDLNEVSVWAQEIGYVLDRTPDADSGGDRFRGHGFGFAIGVDGPLANGALLGFSGSFVSSDAEEPIRPDGEISSAFGQLNSYLGTAMGPVDLDFVVGGGIGRMQERRTAEFGNFSELATAKWWAYEGHAIARASAPLRASSWLVITPQAALTYVGLNEQGYTEGGGGAAIDLKSDAAFSQRLWADVGVELSARFGLGGSAVVAPRLYLGYRANALNEATDRKFQFLSTGESFTLQDEDLGSGGPLVGIGIDATNGYSTVSLSYEGEFTDQIDRHSVNVAIRYRF